MSKLRVKYVCTSCGYDSLKWIGKCPECGSWNSFTEELVESGKGKNKPAGAIREATLLSEVPLVEKDRIKTGIGEFDRVLGGGCMPGSVVLLGGDPGIGKSTLAMQVSSCLQQKVLYVTGEESPRQLKMRAERLKVNGDSFYLLAETEMNNIMASVNELQPSLVIIDSIQTMQRSELENSPGSITQIRECTSLLIEETKKKNWCVIIIGHVTKEGFIAGPKVLEHMVDTVLQFEGEKEYSYRILRAQKNRFGSTNEIGIFEMREEGLLEVKNPSSVFLSERNSLASGSAITCSIEGTRPILIEVQALVTPSHYGNPQRVATGFDYRKLSILLAVLEKRSGMRLSANNVFLNMAGGVKIFEPAIDLAVCCAIASNLMDKVVDNETVIIGEVGLGGEVRSIGHIEKRIKEAEKLGFRKAVVPKNNLKNINVSSGIKLIPAEYLTEAIKAALRSDQ